MYFLQLGKLSGTDRNFWAIVAVGFLILTLIFILWFIFIRGKGQPKVGVLLSEMFNMSSKLAAFEKSKDAIITVNEQGIIRDSNDATSWIFGWTKDEIDGEPLIKLFPHTISEIKEFQRLHSDKDDFHALETTGERSSKNEVNVAITSLKWADSNRYTLTIKDITHRKDNEAARRLIQEEITRNGTLCMMGESIAKLGTWSWYLIEDSERGRLRDEVKRTLQFDKMFGTDPTKKMFAKQLLDMVHGEDSDRVKAVILKAETEKSDYEMEYRIKFSSQKVRCIGRRHVEIKNGIEVLRRIDGTIQEIK